MAKLPLLLLPLLLLSPLVHAQDDDPELKEMDSDIKKMKSEKSPDDPRAMMQAKADDARWLSDQLEAQYQTYMKSLNEQRERLRSLVLGKWDSFDESTTKQWVDYSKNAEGKSKVDFEKGKVVVEVLVPQEDAKDPKKFRAEAEKKLSEQTQKVLQQKDTKDTQVLQDQVKDDQGQAVTPESAPKFVHEELAPKMQVDETPVIGQDKKPRLKVTVEVPLVPEHLLIRARRYQPQVEAAAKKNGLDPALVFAIIQTESEFNPMARSAAPAFGLMQLMPKTAAFEAYRYLHQQDKLLSPDYLYDPDHNIELGTTYLHLLESQNYAKIKDQDNRRSLMIAAYNCGPGCVRKSVLSQGIDGLSNEELVSLIRRRAPKETADYVPRVQGRIPAYRKL